MFDKAQIRFSGDNGRADNVEIEYCQFLNTSGTNEIVAGESNTAGITLGNGWTLAHNLFKNNGSDTSDNTAVFGWVNTMSVHDNIFWEDNPYGTVGHTGSFTAHEVHGSNQTVHNNMIHNYYQGFFLGNNYTSLVHNADIHDNVMVVTFAGVSVFNSGASSGGLQDAAVEPFLAVKNIDIYSNHVNKPGDQTIFSLFASVTPQAGQIFNNIRINNNTAISLSQGIIFRTDIGGGSFGYAEASGNLFKDFVPVAASVAIGIVAIATNTIKTLKLEGNSFIDEQGVPTFQRGIFLQSGTIADLYVGPQTYKGLTVANYAEAGGITITNRLSLESGAGVALKLSGAVGGAVTHAVPASVTSYTETDPPSAPAVNNAVKQYSTGGAAAFSASPGTLTIASGTVTMTTASIAGGHCGAIATAGATGVTTGDSIAWSFRADPGINAGLLNVVPWVTANNVNFKYCNPGAGALTPNVATLNWRVVR